MVNDRIIDKSTAGDRKGVEANAKKREVPTLFLDRAPSGCSGDRFSINALILLTRIEGLRSSWLCTRCRANEGTVI